MSVQNSLDGNHESACSAQLQLEKREGRNTGLAHTFWCPSYLSFEGWSAFSHGFLRDFARSLMIDSGNISTEISNTQAHGELGRGLLGRGRQPRLSAT